MYRKAAFSGLAHRLLKFPGGIFDYTVCERVTVAWGGGGGGGGNLLWTGGGGSIKILSDDFYGTVKDISYTMKRRAQTDYGLKVRYLLSI